MLKINFLFFLLFLLSISNESFSQQAKTTLYFFTGQGADERLFSKLSFPTEYEIKIINYPEPNKNETIKSFALRLVNQIDTTQKYCLIGVSMGGMICSELSEMLNPEKVILISSAKCRTELPHRYRFMRQIPIYKLFPNRLLKLGAFIAQPLVEPNRKKEKTIFKAMLKAKKPVYFKRTIRMIVNWDKMEYKKNILQIHGTKDHTIPIKNIANANKIIGGSHMMVLTKPSEINALLIKLLQKND